MGILSSSSSSFNEIVASQDVENSICTENAENSVLHDSITNFMEDLVKQKEHSLVYPGKHNLNTKKMKTVINAL